MESSCCCFTACFYKAALIIGTIVILRMALAIAFSINRKFFRKGYDFHERYGKDSYVLVTGATAGIGLEICKYAAEKGINVLLAGRSKEKLEKAESSVLKVNPQIKTKTVQIDFNKSTDLSYYQNFMKEVKDIDISVLINNAGVMYLKPFEELPLEEIKETFETNLYGLSILTSLFVQRFLKRNKRCGIVNVASVAGIVPCILMQHYSATKAYARSLTHSLHAELGDKIDIMTHSPCYVETAMTKFYKRLDVASPRDCAYSIFRDIGYEVENNPTMMHEFQCFVVKTMKDFSNPLFNAVSWLVGKYEYENVFKNK